MTVLLARRRKELRQSLQQAVDHFLTEADFARGIFLKPNIVFPLGNGSPEITSIPLVRALVAVLRERRPDVDMVIAEGVAAGCNAEENFAVSGYASLAHELNIPLIDLDGVERRVLPWKFGNLKLPSLAFERTYISLPVLKPSSACVISGALKNQKGLVLPEVKKQFHRKGLHEQLAELNVVVRPALTILDCSYFFGRNVLMSGDNCGEIDATACEFLGIEEPDHLQLARKALVFTDGYPVTGDSLDIKKISSRPMIKEFKRLGRLRLWSNPQACSMCRYVFHNIRRNLAKPENLKAAAKLLPYTVKGAEMIMGTNPKWRKEYESLICFGVCTYRVAKETDCIYIPGCPPTLEDLYKNLP